MGRVVHFEIGVADTERAVKFYREALGWQSQSWPGFEGYYVVTTGPADKPGIDGGILRHKDGGARTVNTVGVDSLEETLAKVQAAGGEVVVPKMPIPGVGWQAYCKDPDGNIFGVHQEDPAAR